MIHNRILLALAASLSLAAGTATAQTSTPPSRIRGTIEKISGHTVTVKTRDGKEAVVVLTDDVKVIGVSKADIGAIKSDSFIGSAAVPQADGTLKALEVTVFPPSMNGTGEGSYAWDLGPNSSMTNGTVGDLVVSSGRVMTVKYKGGGEKKIFVPLDVPIVTLDPTDFAQLKPGAHVIVAPTKAADGTLSAGRVNVGMNGTVPPM